MVPAAHITRDEVGDMLKKKEYQKILATTTQLISHNAHVTVWREEFIEAEAGMTGCNFWCSCNGRLRSLHQRGNADMCTAIPKLHIVAMGIDKVIPNYDSLAVFQRLLCRCGTGQPTTAFTSHFRKARP